MELQGLEEYDVGSLTNLKFRKEDSIPFVTLALSGRRRVIPKAYLSSKKF